MKIADLFNNDLQVSADVYENTADLIGIAYESGTKLTEEGKKHFKTALKFEIKRISNSMLIIDSDKYFKQHHVNIDNYDFESKIPKSLQNVIDLFWSIAGYCSCENFDKWFITDF